MNDEDDEISQVAMQVILNAGDARALMDEALASLAEFDYRTADVKLEEADKKILRAHEAQTGMIQRQVSGEKVDYSILFVHAQDTLMTVDAELHMVHKMLPLIHALHDAASKN